MYCTPSIHVFIIYAVFLLVVLVLGHIMIELYSPDMSVVVVKPEIERATCMDQNLFYTIVKS